MNRTMKGILGCLVIGMLVIGMGTAQAGNAVMDILQGNVEKTGTPEGQTPAPAFTDIGMADPAVDSQAILTPEQWEFLFSNVKATCVAIWEDLDEAYPYVG